MTKKLITGDLTGDEHHSQQVTDTVDTTNRLQRSPQKVLLSQVSLVALVHVIRHLLVPQGKPGEGSMLATSTPNHCFDNGLL